MCRRSNPTLIHKPMSFMVPFHGTQQNIKDIYNAKQTLSTSTVISRTQQTKLYRAQKRSNGVLFSFLFFLIVFVFEDSKLHQEKVKIQTKRKREKLN